MASTERWNFYFKRCHAVSVNGAAVELPEGHGMATIGDAVVAESVFFPAEQTRFELVPGEIGRLERGGFAKRHGKVRKDGS